MTVFCAGKGIVKRRFAQDDGVFCWLENSRCSVPHPSDEDLSPRPVCEDDRSEDKDNGAHVEGLLPTLVTVGL